MWSNLLGNPHRGRLVLGLIIVTFGVGALAFPSFGTMGERGVSIIDLEMIRTSADAAEQVARLGPAGVDAARMSIYLDFPYLVLYAMALSAACIVIGARARDLGKTKLARLAPTAAWLAVIAAGMDAIENIALLQVLAGRVDQPWPGIVFGFSTVKWLLVFAVFAYILVGLAMTLRRKAKTESEPEPEVKPEPDPDDTVVA